MAEPGSASIPDPHLALLEGQLERERQISREAAVSLASLQHRETQISQRHHTADPAPSASGWTIDALMTYLLALREGDRRFYEERDRRYAEVNVEKEKALKIKETADLAALQLAREIQTYKDEKANELREQIASERGNYATKEDLENFKREIIATLRPLEEFVQSARGESRGSSSSHASAAEVAVARASNRANVTAALSVIVALAVLVVLIVRG